MSRPYVVVVDCDGEVEYAPNTHIRGEDSGKTYYGRSGSRKWVGCSCEYYTTHKPNSKSRSHQKRCEERSRDIRDALRVKSRWQWELSVSDKE